MRFRVLFIPGQMTQHRYVIQIRVFGRSHILSQLAMALGAPRYVGPGGMSVGMSYLRFLGAVCTESRGRGVADALGRGGVAWE